ncbi:hypothetical protein H1R20_g11274, partial [Candolleomyces eurysporus]
MSHATVVGQRIITNSAYIDRVGDLKNGEIGGPIIGWARHGGRNQVFNFEPQGDGAKISVGAADGKEVHVASSSPSAGDHLKGAGGGVGSIYSPHPQPDGSFKLSIKAGDGTDLFWTLDSEAEGTKITLMPNNNSSNQLWALQEVGDN